MITELYNSIKDRIEGAFEAPVPFVSLWNGQPTVPEANSAISFNPAIFLDFNEVIFNSEAMNAQKVSGKLVVHLVWERYANEPIEVLSKARIVEKALQGFVPLADWMPMERLSQRTDTGFDMLYDLQITFSFGGYDYYYSELEESVGPHELEEE